MSEGEEGGEGEDDDARGRWQGCGRSGVRYGGVDSAPRVQTMCTTW